MKRHWRRQRHTQAPELNITAFMNLMVILVPFLLITAVFSRITILELEIPAAQESQASVPDIPKVNLQVIVYPDSIEFGDRNTGQMQSLPIKNDSSELNQLNSYLQQVKVTNPDKKDITLLLSENTPYSRVVDVMDNIRAVTAPETSQQALTELFPAISIGDAPTSGQRSEQ